MATLDVGTLFAGRYRIVERIGVGGMGAVYEVVHLETDRRRAMKVMHAHVVESPELRARFKLEARVAAQIESDSLVDVFDAGVDDATGMPFLVMELLRGEELGKRLARVGRLPPGEVVSHLRQVARALEKTHRANIVHRDLKPENLFLNLKEDAPARVKILDFGIAKFVADASTQTGGTKSLGTPLYMAPEQFLTKPPSPASDLYALGLVAFTLLVGSPYWWEETQSGANLIAFALVAAKGPVEAATARAARRGVTLPTAFDAWFARATSAEPASRYASATEMIEGLAAAFGFPAESPLSGAGHTASTPYSATVAAPHVITGPAPHVTGPAPHDVTGPPMHATGPAPSGAQRLEGAPPSVAKTSYGEPRSSSTRLFIAVALAAAVAAGVAVLVMKLGGSSSGGSSTASSLARVTAAPTDTASATPPPPIAPRPSDTALMAPSAAPSASVAPSASAAPSTTAAPTAAPRPPKRIGSRGRSCNGETPGTCVFCCEQAGDWMGPPPACDCFFDLDEWHRTSGGG